MLGSTVLIAVQRKQQTLLTPAPTVLRGALMVPALPSDPFVASTYTTALSVADTFETPARQPRCRRGWSCRFRVSGAQPMVPGTGSGIREIVPVMLQRNEVCPS